MVDILATEIQNSNDTIIENILQPNHRNKISKRNNRGKKANLYSLGNESEGI